MQELNLDTEMDSESFSNFIKSTLANLTVDDYILVIETLADTRPINRQGKWVSFKSLCHSVNLDECDCNLSLNTENMKFTCFSHCGNNIDLLELVYKRFNLIGENKNRYKCMEWICNVLSIPFEFSKTDDKVIEYDWKKDIGKYRKNKKTIDKQEIKVYNDNILNKFPKLYHSEWIKYGISKETLDKFEIKYYPHKNQIIIPCRNRKNELVGIRIRNMVESSTKSSTPRYMPLHMSGFSFKFPTNSILYGECQNEEEIKKQNVAYLVESEKSVLRCDTLMNGKGIALGMMGSAISDENVKYILSLGINRLVILADSDFHKIGDEDYKEFEKKILHLANKFTPFVKVEIVFNNIGIEDMYKASPFDFTVEQFREMYRKRVRLN